MLLIVSTFLIHGFHRFPNHLTFRLVKLPSLPEIGDDSPSRMVIEHGYFPAQRSVAGLVSDDIDIDSNSDDVQRSDNNSGDSYSGVFGVGGYGDFDRCRLGFIDHKSYAIMCTYGNRTESTNGL